jgi:hypothetical protein
MAEWVLIAILSSYNGGGPAVIEFKTEAACKRAIETMKAQFKDRLRDAACVSRS